MGKIKSAIGTVAASVVFLAAPAAAAAAVGTATATCTTSAAQGSCGPYDYSGIAGSNGYNTYVDNDVWNAIPGWSQTLTANSPGSWSVSANMPAGNTAVVSYPDTQQLYTTTSNTPDPLSNFGSITSSFTESSPGSVPGTDYEAAYDIWAGTGSSNYAQEIMIWTDNHGQVPAGSQTGSATIDGVGYQVWSTSGAGNAGNPVTLVMDTNETSGTVSILDDLNWLMTSGYMPQGSGINQIDYGFELCSTNGQNQTFTLSSYGITSTAAGSGGQAPVDTTNAASKVTSSGATLNGVVNPEGTATTYQFQYGQTAGYGSTIPATPGSVGSSASPVNETATPTGLAPNTTYHYQITATNASGTTNGGDQQFTTPPSGTAVTFGSAARAKKANTSSLMWTHTVGASGTNRALLVEATVGTTNDVNCHQTVKDRSVTLKKLAVIHTNNQSWGYMDIWGLVNPPTGANNLSFTVSGCSGGTPKELTAGSVSFTRVSQSTPFSPVTAAVGHSSSPSATIASRTSDLVVGFLANGSAINSVTSPSVPRFAENQDNLTGAGNSAGAISAATGSKVTMGWAVEYDWWGEGILQVNHA